MGSVAERGRPSKFTPDRTQKILDHLRNGCTRQAAAEAAGVWYTTFLDWLQRGVSEGRGPFYDFYEAVTCAEADVEARNTATIQKAADGWESEVRTRTTKTVFRTKKTKHEDGTIIEEPVALEEVTETVVISQQFDWKAALEWLKRRRNDGWSDSSSITLIQRAVKDLSQLSNEELLEIAGHPAGAGAAEGRGDADPAAAGR